MLQCDFREYFFRIALFNRIAVEEKQLRFFLQYV